MTSLEDIIPIGTKFLDSPRERPTGLDKKTGNEYHNAALRVMSHGTLRKTQTGKVFTEAF